VAYNNVVQEYCEAAGTNGRYLAISLALFDDRNTFSPTENIWIGEKIDWVEISDVLPLYPEHAS
jgi:hypothetical protein